MYVRNVLKLFDLKLSPPHPQTFDYSLASGRTIIKLAYLRLSIPVAGKDHSG